MAQHKKKSKIWLLIIIDIILVLVFLGVWSGAFVSSKLSNLTFKSLDKKDLAVNEELYAKVSDSLTKSEFNAVKNVVFFGIDTQSKGDGQDNPNFQGRTDSIIIVSLNPKYKSIKMVSIPRDTYAEIDGYGKTKINHAYEYGQEQLALKTINQNLGLNITEYATIDFVGLINVINDIGGIQLNITNAEKEFINSSSELAYELTNKSVKKLSSSGNVTLDGEQALTHSRNRTVGDDFTRAGRQRQVLEAIMNKLAKMSLSEINEHIDVFLQQVTTNINVMNYIGTITDVLFNKDTYLKGIISEQCPSKSIATGKYIGPTYYFVPNSTEKMQEEMLDYLYRK